MTTQAKRRPTFHTPEVWRQARAAYLEGADARAIEERFGIRENALRRRARLEVWTRRGFFGEHVARTPELSAGDLTPAAPPDPADPVGIAEATLREALRALANGRPGEAAALIKAGDAVGEFADFVAKKRAGAV